MATVTELIGQSVWDPNGVWVGHVVDIRLIKHKGELQQSATVCGLVVSAHRGKLLCLTRDRHRRWGWFSRPLARVLYVGSTFDPVVKRRRPQRRRGTHQHRKTGTLSRLSTLQATV